MEHLNQNMDDLFRKAAEKYPLKTDNANWESVVKKLNEFNASETETAQPVKQKRNRRYWLLLLLPLFLIGYIGYKYSAELKNSTPQTVAKNNSTQNKNQSSPSSKSSNKTTEQTTQINSQKEKDNFDANNFSTFKSELSSKNQINRITYKQNQSGNLNANNLTAVNTLQTSNQHQTNEQQKPETQAQQAFQNRNSQQNISSSQNKPGNTNQSFQNSINASDLKNSTAIIKKDSSAINQQKIVKQKSKTSAHGFYAGIIAAPDISTVKFQSTKNVGYSLGLLAGYQFNKNFSLETGVLLDKKNYYTNGKYFDKEKANIPPSVQLINLDGSCEMFEIPINIKYTFTQKNKGKFFASAGLSSYIMKKESYNYLADYNQQEYYYSKSYNNSTNNFLSVMHISAGYEHKLGKAGNLRIEPYAKIPLSGVGIGKLPITSAGVYIGITRNLTH